MKKLVLFLCMTHFCATVVSQNLWSYSIDSMKNALVNAADDEARLLSLNNLFNRYVWSNPDSAVPYAGQYMMLAQKKKSNDLLMKAYFNYKILAELTGNYAQALEYSFKGLAITEKSKNFVATSGVYGGIAEVYLAQGDIKRAVFYAQKSKSIMEANYSLPGERPSESNDTLDAYASCSYTLCKVYLKDNQTDSVLKYIQPVEWIWGYQWKETGIRWPTIPFTYGQVNFQNGKYLEANNYYYEGITSAIHWNVNKDLMDILNGLAQSHGKLNQWDSSIYYAREVLRVSETAQNPVVKMEALTQLAHAFKVKNNMDSTASYFEMTLAAKDSLFDKSKLVQMQNSTFNEQLRQQEIREADRKRTYRYRLYVLGTGLFVLTAFLIILYRNNRHKQMANLKIEQAYNDLKATQQQLIQSGKMASLGELTAGIAHEIQNPLNFVNNFSEINAELIGEMKDEMDKGNIDDAKAIADDIADNEHKISHHGKRADAIVKGMLLHSQSSTGIKEPTDINKLTDEHLRLAYHGWKAKDKSFNATLKTDFDESVGNINLIPQDIGRVVLNLINNAFYAVDEKKRSGIQNYEPTVSISTKRSNEKIEIKVADNGSGISEKVLDKIFQPFFTTKPTGQGTGLGLSLSYDIVKAHGGEIKVESKEMQGTEFIIQLPTD